ncbi:maleylpyruvate isomerase family mycothiol-dependent enzyme [Nocardioides marmoriginsengisoli]|uniref:Maleylpyruvate isomerase family mycothiol-dependent enzyme n=1 Tax=Nocardioides marmoriginsengisoli TaxID=661483 RepID=A0A3N0CEU4_9ACTN|nr:maleylpyruvate isomerase family mycothiol-dependent enzyme [Nocardioides marmoriginsengisoli]RNL61980.1 maleylpyruvate isomerase family mycothiol-dependent enzyme [Nocardioides marmoriginsengisoli]
MTDLWAAVAAERGALADDLAGLTDEQWGTRSLCQNWTVAQTLAHMTGTGSLTPLSFFGSFARAGFNFNKFANAQIDKHLGSDNAATLANFRTIEHSTSAPPGPKESWLGEAIVHAEDIRRPLGIKHVYDAGAVVQVADFYKGSNTLIGTKSRIAGLALRATDADWSHGEGEEVSGPMLPLLMAMTGRKAGCAELTGPGVALLEKRSY